MGFHLVDRVYKYVTGTSPTAQSILVYLAHRADDAGVRKCYPTAELIIEQTHFKRGGLRNALNELRECNLLTWKRGGRRKGSGGKSLANDYTLHLPSAPSDRQAAPAVAATQPMQGPSDGQCRGRQAVTIIHGQKGNQPSVTGETEAATADLKRQFIEFGKSWEQKKSEAAERAELRERGFKALVEEAMAAAGVTDMENKKIFTSTMMVRDMDNCLEVIMRFASERRAGEFKNLSNPAAVLNKALATLPVVNR